jgi:hypothetical protein
MFDNNDPLRHPSLTQKINEACFYRASTCIASNHARIVCRTSSITNPSEGLIAISMLGRGRIVVICDSDIFGDQFFEEFDHRYLWENIAFWASRNAIERYSLSKKSIDVELGKEAFANWRQIKSLIEEMHVMQNRDGSIDSNKHPQAKTIIQQLKPLIESLSMVLPHQREYFNECARDFVKWEQGPFATPVFSISLGIWNPQNIRKDGILHIAIFPVYLPNARDEVRFEAVLFLVPWPDWLDYLEKNHVSNKAFVPGVLVDYTTGYDSECAVLFPEMVSVNDRVPNHFGVIFCDRESERFSRYTKIASQCLNFAIPPDLEDFLFSDKLTAHAFMLWDLSA